MTSPNPYLQTPISIGIDSGSRMTKLCLYDTILKSIIDFYVEDTHNNHEEQADRMIDKILNKHQIDKSLIKDIITTGYGRKNYSKATKYSSEIVCHARGIYFYNKNIKTLIDIGGQDSKIIKISNTGKVLDFLMNDKCAAGTGRFLEKIAQFFCVEIDDLIEIAEKSDKKIEISSTCVVFAESEIIGLVSAGEKRANIIKAVYNSILHRIFAMCSPIGIESPLGFVGGVAKNKGIVSLMQDIFENEVYVPEMPEFTGALGAALYTP